MSDFWHKLGCCVVEKPQPQRLQERRIDRSMIGEPMNFVHLTHIGSGDMAVGEDLPMVPNPATSSSGAAGGGPSTVRRMGNTFLREASVLPWV
uniref:CDC42 small effector 1 n=1 Tax=Nothoprocta perdicaria TaxID=30464 RepID=A0A8C6YRK9_NOTPE